MEKSIKLKFAERSMKAKENLAKSAEEVLNVIRDIVVEMGGRVKVDYSTKKPSFDDWSVCPLLQLDVKELFVDDSTGEIVISYTSNDDDELMEDLKNCHDFDYHNWVSILNELLVTYARVK